MRHIRLAGLAALLAVIGGCDRAQSSRIAAPDLSPTFEEAVGGGFALSLDGPFDGAIGLDDPSTQQAATGGRASGHVAFSTPFLGIASEKYSFVALSIDPPPPFAAKGQFGVDLTTTLGSEQQAHGEVICLGITGNVARVGARLTKARVNNVPFPLPPGGLFSFWTVQDNGEGAGSEDLASLMRFSSEAVARGHCAAGVPLEQLPSDEGNVQVSSK